MSSFNNSQSPMFSFISELSNSPPTRHTLKSFRQSHSLDLGTLRQSQIFTEFYKSPKAHLQNLENTSQIQFPTDNKKINSFEKPHKLKVSSIDFNDDFKADLNFFSDSSDDFDFINQSQETLLNVKLARNHNELRTFLKKVEKMEGIFLMCEQKTESLQRKAKRLRKKIIQREEEEKRKKEEEM
ncbi:Hypothetical_protein [Hexamita inflata]|uniref:Hypothetical_protein n=1 Tax=Hexamita inflata TaxID=28002 RepID=A0AA86PLP4_9EUKA|nr:Hypothetical protein HINF_LOCUS30035 [Hexamita inflata]